MHHVKYLVYAYYCSIQKTCVWQKCDIGISLSSISFMYISFSWSNRAKENLSLFLVQVQLRTEVPRTQSSTQPGLNSWPSDHDSTVHVTETPALTTRPSVTSSLAKGGYVFGSVGSSVCLFGCLSIRLFVDNITQKLMNVLEWNFSHSSWVVQWRTD